MKSLLLPVLALTLLVSACTQPGAYTYVNAQPDFTTFTAPQFQP
ncbi:MAG: hypothetical protein AAGJ92_01850 [Pseudomonadota bacterium]